MWLRASTTLFLIAGFGLALSFPWVVGARPHGRVALEHYTLRFGFFILGTVLCFVAAAVCALLMIRKVREQYQAESRHNLDHLIESTLRTHASRNREADD